MTVSLKDDVGQALVELSLVIRHIGAIRTACARRLPPGDGLVQHLSDAHAIGETAYHKLCNGLVELGVLDGGGELPEEAGPPEGVTLQ
jgi:hypothetical protein